MKKERQYSRKKNLNPRKHQTKSEKNYQEEYCETRKMEGASESCTLADLKEILLSEMRNTGYSLLFFDSFFLHLLAKNGFLRYIFCTNIEPLIKYFFKLL